MSVDQYITIAILALTFALLIKSEIPPVAVFVGALTLTITFRLAPLGDSLKGFSNPGMLTVGALLMVAAGMYRTGAITLITEKLIGRPKSLLAAQAKILPPVAVGSAFLNNTPPGSDVYSGYPRSCENKSSAGASCSFISPMGYQTNLMVYAPGGYKFTDFVKIGIPMTVVVGIITILLAPLVWPF